MSSTNEKINSLQYEKSKTDDPIKINELDKKLVIEIEKSRKEILEKELEDLRKIKNKKGKSAAIFKLKEKVVGAKKIQQEATILIDPETKNEINTVAEIKSVSLKYCKDLLTNRAPRDDFKEVLENKSNLHEIRMNELIPEEEVELTPSMFDDALARLKEKHPGKYDFILKGGDSLKRALYNLFKTVWSTEEIPNLWKKTNIVQLFKGKGNRNELQNYRNIHTKVDTRKLFGDIVTFEMKQKVEGNISKFQIGAMAGHRAQEHIFTIKSIIGFYNKASKGIILSLYDISKYFDRENLRDCMGELYKADVKGKIYRLIFNLNKDTEVCVRTPVGDTEYSDAGETLGQGTNEGAIISSVNLAGGIEEYFEDSDKEAEFLDIKLGPVLFQDDIIRASDNLESVRDGNKRIEDMAESKILDFNLDKTCVLILGNKKFKNKIKHDIEVNPVFFCGQPVKQLESEKYLGDYFGTSLSESVFITVQKRKGMCERLIREIKVTVEDCRSETVGGLITGLEIWNMAVVPFLFSNSECWIDIPKKAVNVLTSILCSFLGSLFNTHKSCPIMAIGNYK